MSPTSGLGGLDGGSSVAANELRQVKQLLWGLIATKLNPAEVDEVRTPTTTTTAPPTHTFLCRSHILLLAAHGTYFDFSSQSGRCRCCCCCCC